MALTNEAQGGKNLLLKLGNGASGSVTIQNSGDTLTKTAHGLLAGQKVKFSSVTTVTEITQDVEYFVVNPTSNTFQVSASQGGSPIAFASDGNATMVENFETIAGLRSTSLSLNSEPIDVTDTESDEFRELLNSAGMKSVSLSGSGVFKDKVSLKIARQLALSGEMRKWRVYTNTDGDFWEGTFKLTSMEQAGEYNAETTYSISLESSGSVSYTEAE